MNAIEPTRAPRRTQAKRSEATRARLATAAYETVAEGGLKALRLRTVAESAGVSQGALLHHFPDKNALVLAAIEQALTLASADSSVWLDQRAANPQGALRAMLAEFRGFFFSDRFWVAMGITIEASKDADLSKTVRSAVSLLRTPIYAGWIEQLIGHGWRPDDAARDVRSGAAMVSGAAIRRHWAEPDMVTTEIEEEWIAQRLELFRLKSARQQPAPLP